MQLETLWSSECAGAGDPRTARWEILRECLRREDDARSLIRDVLRSDADLIPHPEENVLEVRIHTRANPRSNRAVQHLLDHLNATESTYPGTGLVNFSK